MPAVAAGAHHMCPFGRPLAHLSDFNLSRLLEDSLGSRSSSMAAMNPVRGR